jgi:hypothetical protein
VKGADEFANHGTASIERFYQPIQAVLMPFVPLLAKYPVLALMLLQVALQVLSFCR